MSTDPYHAVQAEMQGTLANAGTLLSSFRRIRGMAVSTSDAGYPEEGEELSYARSEVVNFDSHTLSNACSLLIVDCLS